MSDQINNEQAAMMTVVRLPIDDTNALWIRIPANPNEPVETQQVESEEDMQATWAELLEDAIKVEEVNNGIIVLRIDDEGHGTITWVSKDGTGNDIHKTIQPSSGSGNPGNAWRDFVRCRNAEMKTGMKGIEAFRSCLHMLTHR